MFYAVGIALAVAFFQQNADHWNKKARTVRSRSRFK